MFDHLINDNKLLHKFFVLMREIKNLKIPYFIN